MNRKTDLEHRLEQALKELNSTKPIMVADIKSLIWNEKSQEKVEKIMNLLQEAWNSFPHNSLQGLSPEEKVKKKSPPKTIIAPKTTAKVHNLFPEKYPQKVQFIKIGKIEWGFEFPGYYYDLFERLFQLDEEDISAREYENELKTILRICPETFDAAKDLAEFYIYNKEPKLAREILEETINLAKSYIPNSFIPGKHRIIWADMDNRPFLRLLATYAQFIEKFVGVIKAIPLYQEIITFSPNDNQGIREILATTYLKTNQHEELVELSAHYPNDLLPAVSMGEVLALFKLGRVEEANKKIKKIRKHHNHIIKELLKSAHPKPANLMEDRVTVGGEDEAYYYWQEQGRFWKETKGALEFLQKYLNKT